MTEWIDATLPMTPATVHWPGHPQYTVTNMYSMDTGDVMNVTAIAMCSHFGTHIDAPKHYVKTGSAVDELSPNTLIGPCKVVEYVGSDHISADYIRNLDLRNISRLMIKTRNCQVLREQKFHEEYIALLPEAAKVLVENQVNVLGVDGYSIGPFDPELGQPVHRIFLSAGQDQVAIEEVDLLDVIPGEYEMLAIPLRLTGLEAAPARVFLKKIK